MAFFFADERKPWQPLHYTYMLSVLTIVQVDVRVHLAFVIPEGLLLRPTGIRHTFSDALLAFERDVHAVNSWGVVQLIQ